MNKRPVYEASDLQPQQAGPFTRRQYLSDRRRHEWDPKVVPLPSHFDTKALVLPTAVASIRKAFLLAKTSKDAWKSMQREGRPDVRQAARISRGEQDVFKRKTGTSTTRVKVSVLIDASGSMSNTDSFIQHPQDPAQTVRVERRMAAAVFGATIATALGRIPTVTLDVFQHAAYSGHMVIKYRWAKGTPVAVFNDSHRSIGAGMNADGHALYAVTERMRRELRRGEKGIIMVVSDGQPSVYGDGDSNTGQALIDAVAHARRYGIAVIAVAIDGSDQSVFYGPKGVVQFTGNWNALGSALARQVGDAMAVR
jgi:Mg-chelatase subunit ChlD